MILLVIAQVSVTADFSFMDKICFYIDTTLLDLNMKLYFNLFKNMSLTMLNKGTQ